MVQAGMQSLLIKRVSCKRGFKQGFQTSTKSRRRGWGGVRMECERGRRKEGGVGRERGREGGGKVREEEERGEKREEAREKKEGRTTTIVLLSYPSPQGGGLTPPNPPSNII